MMRQLLHRAWTVGRSAYDLRAPVGQALIAAGGVMLTYQYHVRWAVPMLVLGTVLAGQGLPSVPSPKPEPFHDRGA